MSSYREISTLIRLEIASEWRSKAMLFSTLLYVFATVFICYLSLQVMDKQVWNSTLWIVVLFSLTNAANRVFLKSTGRRKHYLYTLAGPRSIILSKIIYQWLVSIGTAVAVFICWNILFQQELAHAYVFIFVLLLGVMALSNILTLNNALSTETENSPALLAILSFPVMVPVVMTTIKASRLALLAQTDNHLFVLMGVLLLLNVLSFALSLVLFPYLWRH